MGRACWPANVCNSSLRVSPLRLIVSFAVGSLLDIPTHTVNMTTLRSTHDLWQSYSMSPYEVCHVFVLMEYALIFFP
jgi:hypothetical protein